MTLKIKVKHLVYFLIVLFASLPLFAIYIQPSIEAQLAQHELENNQKTKARERIEELLQTASKSQRWEIIKEFMIEPTSVGHYNVYIGSSMSSLTHDMTSPLFSREEMVPYLTEYTLHAPVSGYIQSAAEIVASYHLQANHYAEADSVLEAAQNRYGTSNYEYHNLLMTRLEFAERAGEQTKLDEFITYLKEENLDQHLEFSSKIAEVEVKKMLQNNQYQEALDRITQDIEKLEQDWDEQTSELNDQAEHDPMFLHSSPFISNLISLRNHLEKAVNNEEVNITTIKGKIVKSNGEPLANVGVFLRDERTVNMSPHPEDPFYTVTNQDGSYELNGVLPGSYQIHLGLSLNQIDGWTWPVQMDDWIDVQGEKEILKNIEFKPLINTHSPVDFTEITSDTVTFEWEAVEHAAYYDLGLQIEYDSGASGITFRQRIKESKLDVPVEELYAQNVGLIFGGEPGKEYIQPESLLAFANTTGRFSWNVSAYDDEGNLLTRSNGYRLNEDTMEGIPVFHLKERDMTEADQLVMDREIDKALTQYKEDYQNNPTDFHSLRMITRLIGIEEEGFVEGQEKAFPYMLELAELQPTENTVFQVVDYYYHQENWEEFNQWYDQYQLIVKEEPPTYTQSLYATALMKQGKLEEARNQFQQVMENDKSHRFVGNWIAVEIYLNSNYQEALHIAEHYPERGYNPTDWKAIMVNLEDETIQEVKKSLRGYFEGDTDLASTPDIATFIKALAKVK